MDCGSVDSQLLYSLREEERQGCGIKRTMIYWRGEEILRGLYKEEDINLCYFTQQRRGGINLIVIQRQCSFLLGPMPC